MFKTTAISISLSLCWTVSAMADINLEFRAAGQPVPTGDVVDIGLYAVSDDGTNQLMRSAQVIFSWDPAFLQLLGLDETGAVDLFISAFPANDAPGINEEVPPQDGDGLYWAIAPLGGTVEATPEGALLTTFRFLALADTPKTPVDLLETGGDGGETKVLSPSNANITGTLSGSVVEISVGECVGDLSGDGVVDAWDLSLLLGDWGPNPGHPADFNGDGVIGAFDLSILLGAWGPC